MFGTRSGVPVLDKCAIPVNDIVEACIQRRSFESVRTMFPVTNTEIISCIEYFVDHKTPDINAEHITFEIRNDINQGLTVNTTSVTDWVFLNSVLYGTVFDDALEDNLSVLYSVGLENIVREVFTDRFNDLEDYKSSKLHVIIYESFQKSYGEKDKEQLKFLLDSLGGIS